MDKIKTICKYNLNETMTERIVERMVLLFRQSATLTLTFLLILLLGCSNNDFENTKAFLEFDKQEYNINDDFKLILKIYSLNGEKSIRFYKNWSNVEVSFLPKSGNNGFTQILNERFIHASDFLNDDSHFINTFKITNDKPFEKEFFGHISKSKNRIVFSIPELGIQDSLLKFYVDENKTILVEGICFSLHANDGVYLQTKE